MPLRMLLPASTTPGRFPRWGYLDRYTIDEYLARAFALTVAIVALLDLGVRLWPERVRPPVMPVPSHPTQLTHEVILEPPPSIAPHPPAAAGPRPKPLAHVPLPRPVPAPAVVVDPFDLSGGTGTGTGTATQGEATSRTGDWSGVAEVSDAPAWPSPDQLIVVEHEPELVSMQMPVYPEIARLAHIEGTVLIRVLVDTEGFVRDTRVLQSVLGLDEAAVAAAATAVFRPARQQDRPVAVWVVVPIEFRLHD